MDSIDIKMENALKNKDIVNIMNEASKKFIKQLDQDSIYSCKLRALWKSFVNFNPEKGSKFTTYLFNGVMYECLKELKFVKKGQIQSKKLHHNIQSKDSSDMLLVDILDEAKNDTERSLIHDKMCKLSNQQIAEKYGVTRETMRKRYKKFTKTFEHKFS
jgi:RNA polymerase sigma factor (sigma-70 family)|tara:strand:+ start:646 stop:1122 length:477 start_codon:yes stop_codon:yes gene_type:complete